MRQIIYTFSYKKSLKNSSTRITLSSLYETTQLLSFNEIILRDKKCEKYFFLDSFLIKEKRELCNCIIKEMLHLVSMWRHIRGYPQGGNTTHTNANTSKKNKILFNYRVQQFQAMFGQKKRNIYPTLVKAEYNNRLWFYTWHFEWLESHLFALRMASKGLKAGIFNPVLLANNQTNGYTRTGKAAKKGKAKKLTKVYTIGVPLLFGKYIYSVNTPEFFPRIVLKDEVNKRMGKKFHRRQLKK